MKYAITVDGDYKALLDLDIDEKANWSGDKGFTGKITTDQYGVGQITGGQVLSDGSLSGNASLGSHDATFTAKIDGTNVSGVIHVGWFISKNFEGVQTT